MPSYKAEYHKMLAERNAAEQKAAGLNVLRVEFLAFLEETGQVKRYLKWLMIRTGIDPQEADRLAAEDNRPEPGAAEG